MKKNIQCDAVGGGGGSKSDREVFPITSVQYEIMRALRLLVTLAELVITQA